MGDVATKLRYFGTRGWEGKDGGQRARVKEGFAEK